MRLRRLCEHCSVPGAAPSLQLDVSAFRWCDLARHSVNSECVSSPGWIPAPKSALSFSCPFPGRSLLSPYPWRGEDRNCSGGAGRWECAQRELEAEEIQRGSVLLCFIVSMCAEFTWSFQFWWLTSFLHGKKPTDSFSAQTLLFFLLPFNHASSAFSCNS